MAVSDDAAVHAKHDRGAELKCVGEGESEAGMAELQHQPIFHKDLYPGADGRADLGSKVAAEVAVREDG
jgi:hypothetical protein